MAGPEQTPPPVGEEIHLPGPTLLPVLCAAGITLAIVGITLGWVLIVVGVALFLVTTVRWIADTRRDISALPPEH
jgi:mannose/fructose/N-acetylgalactosamine-specific phosphotransferase system component IID